MIAYRILFFLILPVTAFSQGSATITLKVKPLSLPVLRDREADAWNNAQPGFSRLPAEAKEMLYWTNAARLHPHWFWDSVLAPTLQIYPQLQGRYSRSLMLDLFRTGPLPAFALNNLLVKTAQSHANDIAAHHAPISHFSTNGLSFTDRLRRAGIGFFTCASENISLSSQSTALAVILLYLDIDIPELGHRKALLNASLKEIGVGAARYNEDQYFLVEDMTCSADPKTQ
ncbi:MAG TPA: CAP domain-containing protein [Puia sp.]|nr:CAP domain-containing protein [Puia sp.]